MKTGKGWESSSSTPCTAHHNKMAALNGKLQYVKNFTQAVLKGRKFFGVLRIGLWSEVAIIATLLENNFNYIHRWLG